MASVRAFNHILHRRHAIACVLPNVCTVYNSRLVPRVGQNVSYCTKRTLSKVETDETENKVQVGYTEVVKESVKTVSYLGIVLGGLGIAAFFAYVVFKELFSSNSPNRIYSWAVDRCLENPKVVDALGPPVKAFGEETRRGRRGRTSHSFYVRDGVRYMRMQFYLQGKRRKATVSLEMQENESGNFECRYMYVLVDDIMRSIIKIEDNRPSRVSSNLNSDLELA